MTRPDSPEPRARSTRAACALLAAPVLAVVFSVSGGVARAGHEDDRPKPTPQTLVLGAGPAAPRLEVRHDAGIGAFEIRVLPRAGTEAVLVDPALTFAGARFPLARVEGKEQIWKVVDPRLAVSPLPATFEAKLDERAYSVAFGGQARIASRPVRSTAPRPTPASSRAAAAAAPRVGPEGGRLLPLGDGSVLAEVIHAPAERRLTIVVRDRKDGSAVPIVTSALTPPPVVYLLTPTGAARVPLEPVKTRPDLSNLVKWERTARWTAVSDALATTPLEGRLRLRVADASLEANLGAIDVGSLDPPIEERMTLHGGRLIVFGEGSFHGEVLHDRTAGTLHLWLMDARDKTPIPIADAPTAEIEHAGKVVVLAFAPVRFRVQRKPGGSAPPTPTGRADEWLATHDVLKDPAPLRGRVLVRVTDRPYSAWLSPDLGSRGGRLVRVGDGLARLEVVRDRQTGTMTVYVLDAASPGTVLGAAPVVLIPGRDGNPVAVPLAALEGRTGAYRVVHEDLRAASPTRLRLRVGERDFETPVEEGNTTPPPGSRADQDAVPGDHDPGSKGEDRPPPPTAPPGDQDAIPGDTDPGSETR